jgi:RIO-like serine/threonine protein kinase
MDKLKGDSVIDVFFLLTRRNQLEIIRKCCKVLNSLHKLGMVHGDSHLGNFMIDQEGRIFLVDFEYAYFPSEDSSAKTAVQGDYRALLWYKIFDDKEQLEKLISIEEDQDDFKFNSMLDRMPENYKKPLVEEVDVTNYNIPNYNSI